MARSLRERVVVITGASAGIGRECALLFAREGAHVVVAARRMDRLQALCQEIEAAGGRCLAVPTDVADRALVERLLDATLEHFGRVDIWVNNAGCGLAGTVEQTTPEEMERLLAVNTMGVFHGCQVALTQMRRQGSGQIVNVSSMAARFPLPLHAGYTASKCAVSGLTEALSLELEGSGIAASLVMPALTRTEFTDAMVKKIPDAAGDAGTRFATSAPDVARAIVDCARRRRRVVALVPVPPLTLALFDLLPSLWRAIARRYIRIRTGGRGIQPP